MTYTLIVFPEPLDLPWKVTFDSGVTVTGVPVVHSSGRHGLGFTAPEGTPQGNGSLLSLDAPGWSFKPQRAVFVMNDGHPYPWLPGQEAAFGADEFHATRVNQTTDSGPITIVDDHFERGGRRWIVRGVDGFCDYKMFLDGGPIRDLLKQSQDLNTNVRRVFGCMKNVTDFQPWNYGDGFYTRFPEFCALYEEYGQVVDFDVLPDTDYWGRSLSWCQGHWARFCDTAAPITNRLISLTNEYNHGGNLVGSPNDYPRPNFEPVSQGSAVSDEPPPRPGWGHREMHVLKAWPKSFLIEDMGFNRDGVDVDGTRWGPPKPIYLSECVKFSEGDPNTDEKLARTLAYMSVGVGEGMVLHNATSMYGQLLGPRVSSCVRTMTEILSRV